MARSITPKAKMCRRFGENLFGPEKYATILARKPYRPGVHGKGRVSPQGGSEFGKQLLMKQKVKIIYGVMEKQFRKYFEEIKKKQGVTGDLLMQKLETRLDNVVYRLGFATTRAQARQLVSHKFFTVNGKAVNIPSYNVAVGDEIAVYENKKEKTYLKNQAVFLKDDKGVPSWLQFDPKKMTGKVLSLPQKDDVEHNVDLQLIIEFYSK
ncbi:MAG: 30S ribosomal protein S4 [Candidatus Moranbacteria bacterium]|nr:30S ribosomal protein S4 [Candidatus Moranbacteria bacterium]